MTPNDFALRTIHNRQALDLQREAEVFHLGNRVAKRVGRDQTSTPRPSRGSMSFGWVAVLRTRSVVELERKIIRNLA